MVNWSTASRAPISLNWAREKVIPSKADSLRATILCSEPNIPSSKTTYGRDALLPLRLPPRPRPAGRLIDSRLGRRGMRPFGAARSPPFGPVAPGRLADAPFFHAFISYIRTFAASIAPRRRAISLFESCHQSVDQILNSFQPRSSRTNCRSLSRSRAVAAL